MNYFIFNYTKHSHLLNSFLESVALAHNHSKIKSREWFLWKFRDNPFGESILACVEEHGKIVGGVAYGKQPFFLRGHKLKGVISFETFVHPGYQGQGIFGKLLKLAEAEVCNSDTDVMLNFPNLTSLKGFLNNGWSQTASPEYWIKGSKLFTIPFNVKNVRQGFKPLKSNLESLNTPLSFEQNPKGNFCSEISLEYLKWRFFSYPVSEYIIIDTKICYSILRMGKRGNLREAQVLFINITDEDKFSFTKYLIKSKSKAQYDIISFSISKHNLIRKHLKKAFFIKVPNQTNICYKILNKEAIKREEVEQISLSAINYHTY